jgi:hypothetical protein
VIYHRVSNDNNTTGATGRTGIAYPSGTPDFLWFMMLNFKFSLGVFCRSLFVLCSFFLGYCIVIFFDLQLLITPLVSSDYPFGIFKLCFDVFAHLSLDVV